MPSPDRKTLRAALNASLARSALLVAAAWPVGAHALDASLTVTVQVRVLGSSGACGVVPLAAGVGVGCSGTATPQGAVVPLDTVPVPAAILASVPGALLTADATSDDPFRFRLAGPEGVVPGTERARLPGTPAEISSWRTVYLDNRPYVELTVSW